MVVIGNGFAGIPVFVALCQKQIRSIWKFNINLHRVVKPGPDFDGQCVGFPWRNFQSSPQGDPGVVDNRRAVLPECRENLGMEAARLVIVKL